MASVSFHFLFHSDECDDDDDDCDDDDDDDGMSFLFS